MLWGFPSPDLWAVFPPKLIGDALVLGDPCTPAVVSKLLLDPCLVKLPLPEPVLGVPLLPEQLQQQCI